MDLRKASKEANGAVTKDTYRKQGMYVYQCIACNFVSTCMTWHLLSPCNIKIMRLVTACIICASGDEGLHLSSPIRRVFNGVVSVCGDAALNAQELLSEASCVRWDIRGMCVCVCVLIG